MRGWRRHRSDMESDRNRAIDLKQRAVSSATGIVLARWATMSSGFMPSASALKLVTIRCRSTGGATARMSSPLT